jgi:FHA domain
LPLREASVPLAVTKATEVSNMTKCPFCHFDNEDGALFCEQCKSDLGGVPVSVPAAEAVATAEPVVEAVIAEAVAVEAVGEPALAMAEPVEAIPMATAEAVAEPVEAEPVEAEPVEAEPAEAAPVPVGPTAEAPPPAPPPAPAPAAPAEPVAAAPPSAAPQPAFPTAPGSPAAMPTAPAAAAPAAIPSGAEPRLLVLRGQRRNVEYPIYEGLNFIGRADEKPVDIDLEDQEPPDRIWCSRQHACISFEGNQLAIEDLNSANGTYINRAKLYPGQKKSLNVNDIIQIGNVQMKVIV